MTMINYLIEEQIVQINKEVLNEIKVKRADSFKVLSWLKLRKVLQEVECQGQDVFDKATLLLKGLAQEHPFASGNRRTALVSTLKFLEINHQKMTLDFNPKVLQGVRENYYSNEEIKEWLKGGDIRGFKRK